MKLSKLSPSHVNETTGIQGEWAVFYLLRAYGLHVVKQPHLWAFDLWINDKLNVEVKTAKPRTTTTRTNLPAWHFNIHRHGKLPERQPDFYLFRLEDIPYTRKAIHFLLKAPVTVMTIGITLRSLLNQDWYKEREEFLKLVGRGQ